MRSLVSLMSITVVVAQFSIAPKAIAEEKEDFNLLPDMAITIPIIFDGESKKATYDWALVAEDESAGVSFVETSTFQIKEKTYEFLLSTKKAVQTDEEYTVPDYFALTLTTRSKTVMYIDLGANGYLDSVFVDEKQTIDPGELAKAQTQYTAEIVAARDHLL